MILARNKLDKITLEDFLKLYDKSMIAYRAKKTYSPVIFYKDQLYTKNYYSTKITKEILLALGVNEKEFKDLNTEKYKVLLLKYYEKKYTKLEKFIFVNTLLQTSRVVGKHVLTTNLSYKKWGLFFKLVGFDICKGPKNGVKITKGSFFLNGKWVFIGE